MQNGNPPRGPGRPVPAEHLPIDDVLGSIVDHLDESGVVVVIAPPGAGKTTRVPLALLDRPWRTGRVVLLEPRRVAARAAANRMAQQLGESVGGRIGLTTRDDRRVGPDTVIEVVTEGVIVRRLLRDGDLPGVSAVLFDEFHERSLDADLALGLCLELRDVLRPDLRLAVLSATMDADAVGALVSGPVVSSEGRAHAVTVQHVDVPVLAGLRSDHLAAHLAPAIREAMRDQPGDVLVFLPGVREIGAVRSALGSVDADVLDLHGGLPPRDQDAALRPGSRRRVVLATDLAESSVTVPGVRIVVDAGLAREPRLDARLGMTRLVTVPASRASADQRAGRAGRVAPGHAVRLWPSSSHGARPAWPVPELAQSELSGFRLSIAAWGGMPEELRLLDAIPGPALDDAEGTLTMLGAIDGDGRITDHGRLLADLPLHPRLAHLLVVAASAGRVELGAELAALLAERDVIGRRHDRPDVDLMTRLAVLRGGAGGRGPTVASVRKEAKRLLRLARRLPSGAASTSDGDDESAVGILLASAWPDRIGRRRPGQRGSFQLANGRGALLHDGDALAGEDWIVAPDVDAGQVDARVHRAAALDVEAFTSTLAGLVRRERRARWSEQDGRVEAAEVDLVGQLVLRSRPLAAKEVDLRPALLDAVRSRGLRLLPWNRAASSLRDRLGLLHGVLGPPWPDVGDEGLLADLESWLLPHLPADVRRLEDLGRARLADALRAMVPPGRYADLDVLAPTHLNVPSGSRVAIDYTPDGPVLAVKVQEVFGWAASPTVVDGNVPIVLHLLSPAGRPLHVTADLGGFWDGVWSQVRAEMRGRYPKHAWPEDPREVGAHRGTKKRQRRG